MLQFESIGYVDNVGYGRTITERFRIIVDGKYVGCKDLWYDGYIFAFHPPHKTYYINCPDEIIPDLKQYWDVEEDEGGYLISWDINDGDIEDIVRRISFLIRVKNINDNPFPIAAELN